MNLLGDKTVSLRKLNWGLFITLSVVIAVAVYIPNTITYYTLRAAIPAEKLVEIRHASWLIDYIPAIVVGFAILAVLFVSWIIGIEVTHQFTRLSRWATSRYKNGEGPDIRMRTRVEEIGELARVFNLLFGEQLTRVKELRTLLDSTRHDIRDHLAVAYGAAQTLRDTDSEKRKQLAERIICGIDTTIRISDLNAAMTRNYCCVRGAEPKEIRLSDIVHDCLDELEPAAYRHGLVLDSGIPPSSLRVVAHKAHLAGVIRNLVQNAIKYTPEGGTVRLNVKGDATGVTIMVADTGIGIPDADKSHVFELKYRAGNTGEIEGDGRGLAYVDSVVALYKGTHSIADNTPHGTIITINLPIHVKTK